MARCTGECREVSILINQGHLVAAMSDTLGLMALPGYGPAWAVLPPGQQTYFLLAFTNPVAGFGGLQIAKHTLAGYGVMAMIRKGQVHNVGGRNMQAQAAFVAGLFGVAAKAPLLNVSLARIQRLQQNPCGLL